MALEWTDQTGIVLRALHVEGSSEGFEWNFCRTVCECKNCRYFFGGAGGGGVDQLKKFSQVRFERIPLDPVHRRDHSLECLET